MRSSVLVLAGLVGSSLAQTTRSLSTDSEAESSTSSAASSTASSSASELGVYLPSFIRTCEPATFTFTSPGNVHLYAGAYVSGEGAFLEVWELDPRYDSLPEGSFQWTCDFPAGLKVSFQLWFFSGDQQITASTPSITVTAGASTNCLAQNDGQNTQSILSYASSIDPLFTYDPNAASATSTPTTSEDESSSSNIGAIVGGVVGGLAAIVLLAALLFWYKRRSNRRRNAWPSNASGFNEKGSMSGMPYHHTSYGQSRATPPSVLDNHSAYEMAYGAPPSATPLKTPTRPPMTYGSLPEPMDAQKPREVTPPHHAPSVSGSTIDEPRSPLSESGGDHLSPFTPVRRRESTFEDSQVGSEELELEDPSSFSPARQAFSPVRERPLDDPSSFSPHRAQ